MISGLKMQGIVKQRGLKSQGPLYIFRYACMRKITQIKIHTNSLYSGPSISTAHGTMKMWSNIAGLIGLIFKIIVH